LPKTPQQITYLWATAYHRKPKKSKKPF
jgi:hypothetical protein